QVHRNAYKIEKYAHYKQGDEYAWNEPRYRQLKPLPPVKHFPECMRNNKTKECFRQEKHGTLKRKYIRRQKTGNNLNGCIKQPTTKLKRPVTPAFIYHASPVGVYSARIARRFRSIFPESNKGTG